MVKIDRFRTLWLSFLLILPGCTGSYVEFENNSPEEVSDIRILGGNHDIVVGELRSGEKHYSRVGVSGEGELIVSYIINGRRYILPLCYFTPGLSAKAKVSFSNGHASPSCR